jgi:hypothetical protein
MGATLCSHEHLNDGFRLDALGCWNRDKILSFNSERDS